MNFPGSKRLESQAYHRAFEAWGRRARLCPCLFERPDRRVRISRTLPMCPDPIALRSLREARLRYRRRLPPTPVGRILAWSRWPPYFVATSSAEEPTKTLRPSARVTDFELA